MVWNSFPDFLRDPTLSIDNFRSALKTQLFAAQRDALEAMRNALYKSTTTTVIIIIIIFFFSAHQHKAAGVKTKQKQRLRRLLIRCSLC